jgi:lysozyme
MDESYNSGLPPGLHPEGLLGGIALGQGTESLNPVQVQTTEISFPALNLADSSFRMPPLPPDALAGAFAPTGMTASQGAVDFIKSYERGPGGGPALTPYHSPEGGRDTVGWGHKLRPGEDYSQGLTANQADQLFLRDLAAHQKVVQDSVKVPLSQQQFDALVSLGYNLPGAFVSKDSKLLRELNQGNYSGAADQLPRWNHMGKAVMPGLTKRRSSERDMFLNGIYTNHK